MLIKNSSLIRTYYVSKSNAKSWRSIKFALEQLHQTSCVNACVSNGRAESEEQMNFSNQYIVHTLFDFYHYLYSLLLPQGLTLTYVHANLKTVFARKL